LLIYFALNLFQGGYQGIQRTSDLRINNTKHILISSQWNNSEVINDSNETEDKKTVPNWETIYNDQGIIINENKSSLTKNNSLSVGILSAFCNIQVT
jgi:hypothetical protein